MSNRYLYRKNSEKSEVKDVGLPSNIDDLVTLLDETFPLINPTPTASISDIQRKAGQRDVVDWLLELKNRKDNNVLGK
tara:strand:- start:22 stop:255 length:234 start_codon:yes stop_codon:yes gene_type:complete